MGIYFSSRFTQTDRTGEVRTGGFFDTAIHGDDLPDDAVPISTARHAELMEAQAEGKELYADDDGIPRYREPRVDAAETRAALVARVRAEARRRITAVSPEWRQLNDMREPSDAGAARFAAIDGIRAASGDLERVIGDTRIADLETLDPTRDHFWPKAN